MSLTVYHLKTCDTCRKAIKALKESQTLNLIDVRADGVPDAAIKDWISVVGYEAILNTRSTTWRGLSEDEKTNIDADKALSLLSAYPTLIKRPVITDGETLTIGWKADAQKTWLS